MPNYDGQYELRLFYNTLPAGEDPMDHTMTIDVAMDGTPPVGAEFGQISTLTKGGGASDLEADTTALVDLLEAFFNPTTNFLRAELWRYDAEPSQNAIFVSIMALGTVGTFASPTQAAQQSTMTLRSAGGGVARIQMMEAVYADNLRDPYPFSRTPEINLVNYLIGSTCSFVARDNTYFVAGITFSTTQNERLYRKRFRNN